MRKFKLLLAVLSLLNSPIFSQNTFTRVYEIFQQKCASCHSNATPEAGLDLQGAGANQTTRETAVFNNLVNKTPSTAWASGQGMKLIYPGRIDRSFLFHKINNGLEPTIALHQNGGQSMPPYGNTQLTEQERELIRQWVLHGARRLGNQADESLLADFYDGKGIKSFPNGPPEKPAEQEGFQIKMGPFYLRPAGQLNDELEYFTKYELNLTQDVEVNRIEIFFSSSSHHFIMYKFGAGGDRNILPGFRLDPNHSDISLVAAVQEPTNLKLPQGTAFKWAKNLVLDLNSHYINYSATQNLQAEVYVNIYTQPTGTARQEMKTDLLVNQNIPIPNNGNEVTHTQTVAPNLGQVFAWGIMGHTHKYGRDYKVYRRVNSQRGELIYDASCPRGIPGCSSPFFDYRHIPMRYFEPLNPILFNFQNGIIHEAKWVNNGPSSVFFGPTSDDEMMVMVLMYTTDTTGIVYSSAAEPKKEIGDILVFPNPTLQTATVSLPMLSDRFDVQIFDMFGRLVRQYPTQLETTFTIEKDQLTPGVYFLKIVLRDGRSQVEKIIFE